NLEQDQGIDRLSEETVTTTGALEQEVAPAEHRSWPRRTLLTLIILAFVGFLAWSVSLRQALLLLVGLGMGMTLAGARFGFTTAWRTFIERRDPSGILAQLLLLGLAAVLCMP